jgi:hypothetical protein
MKSGYNTYTYTGWTQTEYLNKHYNTNQKDEGTWDDRGRDGGTNFILRTKEQETHLILHEHDDDDDDDDDDDFRFRQAESDNIRVIGADKTSLLGMTVN